MEQNSIHKGHELVDSIIYGPVRSRRYGRSLGVNLIPSDSKICNFNCVYCQLGWSEGDSMLKGDDFLPKDQIISDLKENLPKWLGPPNQIDDIVLSGNGEPTLHPDFVEIAGSVLSIRDQFPPRVPVVCLTNGSTLAEKKILDTLQLFDECCVKLDAGCDKIDLPHQGFRLDLILPIMKNIENLVIQSCFMKGGLSNVTPEQIDEWLGWMSRLYPKRVDLYTIARDTPAKNIEPVEKSVLEKIAARLKHQGKSEVRVVS